MKPTIENSDRYTLKVSQPKNIILPSKINKDAKHD